jgi:hypothetical protein
MNVQESDRSIIRKAFVKAIATTAKEKAIALLFFHRNGQSKLNEIYFTEKFAPIQHWY